MDSRARPYRSPMAARARLKRLGERIALHRIRRGNTHSPASVPPAGLGTRKQHPPPPLQFRVSVARHSSHRLSFAELRPPAAALAARPPPGRRAYLLCGQRPLMFPDPVY